MFVESNVFQKDSWNSMDFFQLMALLEEESYKLLLWRYIKYISFSSNYLDFG